MVAPRTPNLSPTTAFRPNARARAGLDSRRSGRRSAASLVPGGATSLLAEFTEIESGKRHTNRPELLKAIELSRRQKATLVIAKLDRLARNVHFISGLMETGVEFVAADMPQANRLTIHILAAFAEHEREAISQRTKGALQAAKKRGTRLGNPRWAESIARARQAKDPIPPAPQLVEMMRRHRAEGMTLRAIAAQLNGLGLRTPGDRSGTPAPCKKQSSESEEPATFPDPTNRFQPGCKSHCLRHQLR